MTQCQRQGQLQKLKPPKTSSWLCSKACQDSLNYMAPGSRVTSDFPPKHLFSCEGPKLEDRRHGLERLDGQEVAPGLKKWFLDIDISRFSLIRWFSLQSLKHENCKMSQVTEVCFTFTIFHLSSFSLSRWLTRVLNDPHSRGLWCLELRGFLEVGGIHTLPDQAPPLAASAPAEPEGGGKVVGTVTDHLFLHGHCVYCLYIRYININHHLHKHTDRVRGFRLVWYQEICVLSNIYSDPQHVKSAAPVRITCSSFDSCECIRIYILISNWISIRMWTGQEWDEME